MTPIERRQSEGGPAFWKQDQAHLAISVDTSIYSVDAILRAAYKLSDRAYWLLDGRDDDRVVVFAMGKRASDDVEPVALAFTNELVDQQLRIRLEAQFGGIRDTIVAQAFSEGNLLDPARDDGDYRADPRGAGRHR